MTLVRCPCTAQIARTIVLGTRRAMEQGDAQRTASAFAMMAAMQSAFDARSARTESLEKNVLACAVTKTPVPHTVAVSGTLPAIVMMDGQGVTVKPVRQGATGRIARRFAPKIRAATVIVVPQDASATLVLEVLRALHVRTTTGIHVTQDAVLRKRARALVDAHQRVPAFASPRSTVAG